MSMDKSELTTGMLAETNEVKSQKPVDKRLVDRAELKNSWKLAHLKLRNEFSRGARYIGIILGVLLLTSLISGVIWLLTPNNKPEGHSFMDMSSWLPIGVVIGIIAIAAGYANTNKNYEIYPQTNTCRFLSTQALYYAIVIFISVALLVIYLIQYATVALIAFGQENTTLPYVFDPLFLIAGFFVLIVGLSLAVACISFMAALICKFRIYAAVALIVMLAVLFARGPYGLGLVSTLFSFFSSESSVILFLIKGIVLWGVLFVLTYVINRYTVYYRSNGAYRHFFSRIAAIGVAVFLITGGTTYLVKPVSLNQLLLGGGSGGYSWSVDAQNMEFDISGLPEGSSIHIVASGDIAIPRLSGEHITGSEHISDAAGWSNYQMTYYYDDGTSQSFPAYYLLVDYYGLNSISGDKLVVHYYPPFFHAPTQIWLNPANSRLEARLEGTTLYLDYTYDKNVKLAFLPAWTFMGQFDYFIGKDIFEESQYQTRGQHDGYLYIEVR